MSVDSVKKGILWTGLEKVLVYGINFIQGVILARLLSPSDFGLTAMLGIFLSLANAFSEGGLGTALVQSRTFTRDDERKVLGFSLGIGALCTITLLVAAPLIASFYQEPQLVSITRALSLSVVLGAPAGVAVARLQRTGRFGLLSTLNIASAVAIAALAGLLAVQGFGVWTLVWTGVVGAALRTVLFWLCARGIEPPVRDGSERGGFGRLIGFGWKLTASYLVTLVYRNAYSLVLGKFRTPIAVGFYTRASSWAELPGTAISEVVGRVAFPMLADLKDDRVRLWEKFSRSTWLGMGLLIPALTILWLFASPIIRVVFGEQWISCVPLLRILILGAVFWPLTQANGYLMGACGRSDLVLKMELARRPVDVMILLAGCWGGLEGVCWAKVLADTFDWLTASWFARQVTGRSLVREAVCL